MSIHVTILQKNIFANNIFTVGSTKTGDETISPLVCNELAMKIISIVGLCPESVVKTSEKYI
jgi:hypothetical protein